jgi:two-component system chemotaxis response regulator CheY
MLADCGVAMHQRVLIVDDSLLMRRLVARALVADGWEVVGEAGNGLDAAERYRELRPDAVTLDITMPGYDGLHAVQAIIEIDPKARIVVVIAQAVRAGAQGFVAKPFQPEHLQEAMRVLLEEPAEA